ncbi:hypothetical protein MLD38_026887 [Melastoma candidum]|uniref:Uncharacterized protein n=1 Tax=Melastoma candidum TaxID=119954 RepID=A0ACB9P2Y1_9MYRT|nr:hypothetical protein MLD38_026887 [Melastoma candidum]
MLLPTSHESLTQTGVSRVGHSPFLSLCWLLPTSPFHQWWLVMGERMQGGNSFFQFPPSGLHAPSPHRIHAPPPPPPDRERYLAELLGERQKFHPFTQVLPHCGRLLNLEIRRISGYNLAIPDHDGLDHEGHYMPSNPLLNGMPSDFERWSIMRMEENGLLPNAAPFQAAPVGWPGTVGVQSAPVVKKVIRLDVPVDKNPNYNFVGRILGPRGNSLKRVESMTQCRVYIRGKGSVKDPVKEEKLRDKPGYEHLNEPLHILVEAEFPENMVNIQMEKAVTILENLLKPVDESMDHYKKQQLRELAMINGTLKEGNPDMSPGMSPCMSPFSNTGMKRPKMVR